MIRFTICLLSLIFLLISCRPAAAPVSVSNRPASINDVPLRKPLSELSWTASDGNEVKVRDVEGKVLILDFWATYCIPCKDEIPHLNELQAKYRDNGLRVIGLNAGGDEDRPKIPEFRRQTAIDYELAYPDDELIQFVFGSDSRIPQTMIVDRSGKIVKKIVGFNEDIKKELDDALSAAMSAS